MIFRRTTSNHLCALLLGLGLTGAGVGAERASDATVVQDPYYGEVLFHFYQEDYFPAIVRLLAAQKTSRLPNHEGEAELLLGGMYLSYGHHQRAADIFERLLADSADPTVRDRTWFFLARIWHQRGYYAEARDALNKIEGELPGTMPAEKRLLLAQLMIKQGEYGAAIELLDRWHDRSEWGSYARFNLGVAMVRNGQVDGAADILDELGRIEPHNEELSALRDKANLALGYAYLQSGEPRAAKEPLQRVRLNGPFSNKALLGVGWADAERDDFGRALVPWMELRGRNLLDPAVQESMLAVPYAMAKLDSISQAADHYLNAIEAFREEDQRIDGAIDALRSGSLLNSLLARDADATTGWHWTLTDLPDGSESRYLYHLLATHAFQEGLKNFRDLDYLARNLENWRDSIDVFQHMLDTRTEAYARRLPQVEESLERAQLEDMVDRKLSFDARLDGIEHNRDTLALASNEEFALWGEVMALASAPAVRANIPEAEDLRRKLKLLRGTLQWELDKEFKERLWHLRRNVRQTGEALVETQRSRRRVDESLQTEPETFATFDSRVRSLNPQIKQLRARVSDAMDRQRVYLQSIAIGEMQAQQERLQTYTVQARFALAAIYDLSATGGEASP